MTDFFLIIPPVDLMQSHTNTPHYLNRLLYCWCLVNILCNADDIVLLAPSWRTLQSLPDCFGK